MALRITTPDDVASFDTRSLNAELRVLLVGVEDHRRVLLTDQLSKYYACCLDSASTLNEALTKLASPQSNYEVVVVNDYFDSNIAPHHGIAIPLLRQISHNIAPPQVVVYTNIQNGGMSETLEAGAFRYLHPPIEPHELVSHIRQAAEYHRLSSAERERGILESLMRISAKLLDSRDEKDVLDLILEGVQAIGLDRVRLYQFDEERKVFVERSSKGMEDSFVGREWFVKEFPYFPVLSEKREPLILKREPGGHSRFDQWLAKEGIDEWISVLLVLRGQIVGKLSADNGISGRSITQATLKPFGLFASQAAVAIENARLFSEAETKRRNLAAVLEISTQVNPSLNLEQTLNAACKIAVDLLGVNHSGLMLFEDGNEVGRVLAEYPEIGTKGLIIPLRGVPTEERLLNFQEPILIPDITQDPSFAPVAKPLLDQGIQSMMFVPIISQGRLLGSLGLDTVGYAHRFSKDDVDLCKIFAAQIAVAIENAQLYQEVQKRAKALETLRNTSSAITLAENPVLKILTKRAVDLLRARGGGIYKYYPEREELAIVAASYKPEQVGKTLRLGEGMAGQLVKNDVPFMSVNNYNEWPGRASVFADEIPFEAVLEVPIRWQDSVIGVLYVEDKAGRLFGEDDAKKLAVLANQTAIALATTELIANAQMLASDQTKSESLKKLAAATDEIVGDLVNRTLDDRLDLIAKHAADILQAQACGVFLVKQEGFLSLEASYGHREGGFQKGKSLAIRSGPKTGLTGHIAYQGKMFNAKGEELVNHYAVRGIESHHTPEKRLFSLLAIPLKKKVANREELVGLLRVDNKKDRDGKVKSNIGFTEEDESILTIFSEEVVVALENAELMRRIKDERSRFRSLRAQSNSSTKLGRDEFAQLLDAARFMISATDLQEMLSTVAEQAQVMLSADACLVWARNGNQNSPDLQELVAFGVSEQSVKLIQQNTSLFEDITRSLMKTDSLSHSYDASSPANDPSTSLGNFMDQLGWNSFYAIDLRAGDESVGLLLACYKERIPYRLLEERRILLENFTTIVGLSMKKTRLLDQITRANDSVRLIARALSSGNTDEALSHIVRGIVEVIGCDAVTLYTYDKIKKRLLHPPTSYGLLDSEIVLRQVTPDSLPYKMLLREDLYIAHDVNSDPFFSHSRFAKDEKVRSLLAIPLAASERKVGLMFINYRVDHHFNQEELDYVWLFAQQASLVIYNSQVIKESDDTIKQRQALSDFSENLLGSFDYKKTLEQAVTTAADILRCEFCSIVSERKDGSLAFDAVTGFRHRKAGDVLDRSVVSQTAYTIKSKQVVRVDDYELETRFQPSPLIAEHRIKSGLSAPMFLDGKITGAMLVHTKLPRKFTDEEESLLSLIANQTAIAAHNARQFEALERRRAQLTTIYEAVNVIGASFGRERSIVLDEIIEQAVICVKGSEEQDRYIGTVQLYDDANKELTINSVYPKKFLNAVVNRGGRVRPLTDPATQKIGIVGRSIVSKQSLLVPDVREHDDYIPCDPNIKSQLTVPLIDGDKVLGVVSIESRRLNAFDDEDLKTLEALAKHIVIALKNSDQYLELRRTKGMVGSRTALAWMGMASSTWLHDIAKHASNIANLVMLLRRNLGHSSLSEKDRQIIEEKFARIEAQSEQIQKRPITSPLSADQGVTTLGLNEFVANQVDKLSEHSPYSGVGFETYLHATRDTVRCNPEWLGQALKILIDNAAQAMEDSLVRMLTVRTQSSQSQFELRIIDTGPGIPEELLETLLSAPVQKKPSSRGFGVGLLIAQAIIETYGGAIKIEQTDREGTTMLVILPLAQDGPI